MPVWIDAVCNKQSDTSEKSYQVQLMSRIHAQARQVWISLGDSNELLKQDKEYSTNYTYQGRVYLEVVLLERVILSVYSKNSRHRFY